MGLADFMQQLQEQDSNIVYSEEPEQSIKIIPPERSSVGIKIIPPEEIMTTQQPMKIKIKLKKPMQQQAQQVQNVVSNTTTVNNTVQKPTVETIQKPPPIQQVVEHKKVEESKPKELTEDELFIKSGTESSKKQIWLEYYQKAKTSRKQNVIVDKMKIGRFTITPDNKVLILPDYDVVNKDPDDILKDHWW